MQYKFSLWLPIQLQEGKELQLEWLGFHWDVFENGFSIPACYLRRAVTLCPEALCACPALSGVFKPPGLFCLHLNVTASSESHLRYFRNTLSRQLSPPGRKQQPLVNGTE